VESAPAEEEARTVTRTVTVQEGAAPPETTAAMETTGTVEASAEPTSPCGGAPEDVLALQYRLINAGDYEGAYELFAERSKGVISLEQYRAFFEANSPYSVTDYSFPSVDVRGEAAIVGAAFTVDSPSGREVLERTQELVCEGNVWGVVMREEQAAAFAGAREEGEEAQYDAPEAPPPDPEPQYEPAPSPPPSEPSGEDLDCADFDSPAEAQEAYEDDPSDPNGLDANADGEACEDSFGGASASPEGAQYEGRQYEKQTQHRPTDGASVPPISESNCPSSHPVKGNQSDIYHDIDSPYYDATNPEECYATAADAENAGYRAPKR
jgi:hypothetical protein